MGASTVTHVNVTMSFSVNRQQQNTSTKATLSKEWYISHSNKFGIDPLLVNLCWSSTVMPSSAPTQDSVLFLSAFAIACPPPWHSALWVRTEKNIPEQTRVHRLEPRQTLRTLIKTRIWTWIWFKLKLETWNLKLKLETETWNLKFEF